MLSVTYDPSEAIQTKKERIDGKILRIFLSNLDVAVIDGLVFSKVTNVAEDKLH